MSHRYMVIDTETTGLPLRAEKGQPPIPADAPGQPRLASFAMIVTTPDLHVDEDQTFCTLITPDGWAMSAGASAVNGLTDEMLEAQGLPVRDVLRIYSGMVRDGWIVVAHHAQFDTKIMRGELRRAGMDDLFEETLNICTLKACRELDLKPANLGACYRHFTGKEIDKAHTAFADAYACLDVFRALHKMGAVPEPSILRSTMRQD